MTTMRSKPGATARLRDALASVEGSKLTENEPLAGRTSFRIGGTAALYAEVSRETALSELLRQAHRLDVPFFLLGLGSNILVPDEGFDGVVGRLVGAFRRVEIEGTRVEAGGATVLSKLVRQTVRRGLVGIEALAGFPSTVGGAVRMNAGSYGTEICDVLQSATVMDRRGVIETLTTRDLEPGYRSTRLQKTDQIVTRVVLELEEGDGAVATRKIAELGKARWEALPKDDPHAGSVFRNPADGPPAGRLIDECGLKGATVGGAQVSPRHANVIVNVGGARARDVLELMVRMHEAVAVEFEVLLEPEVVLMGDLSSEWCRRTARARERLTSMIGRGENRAGTDCLER